MMKGEFREVTGRNIPGLTRNWKRLTSNPEFLTPGTADRGH